MLPWYRSKLQPQCNKIDCTCDYHFFAIVWTRLAMNVNTRAFSVLRDLIKMGEGTRALVATEQKLNQSCRSSRRFRKSHNTDNRRHCGHPQKRTLHKNCCLLHNLVLKDRQISASDLVQGLSLEISVSVTDRTVWFIAWSQPAQTSEKESIAQ